MILSIKSYLDVTKVLIGIIIEQLITLSPSLVHSAIVCKINHFQIAAKVTFTVQSGNAQALHATSTTRSRPRPSASQIMNADQKSLAHSAWNKAADSLTYFTGHKCYLIFVIFTSLGGFSSSPLHPKSIKPLNSKKENSSHCWLSGEFQALFTLVSAMSLNLILLALYFQPSKIVSVFLKQVEFSILQGYINCKEHSIIILTFNITE